MAFERQGLHLPVEANFYDAQSDLTFFAPCSWAYEARRSLAIFGGRDLHFTQKEIDGQKNQHRAIGGVNGSTHMHATYCRFMIDDK